MSCSHFSNSSSAHSPDPYIWMEDVLGERPLQWVRNENARSLELLEKDPRFSEAQSEALRILEATDRIPYSQVRGGYAYNFWQDAQNVRGIWRRTKVEEFSRRNPRWETLIDFDELARAEGKNHVFKGSSCFELDDRKCLIFLSDGGKDASTVREFDLSTKSFVAQGFVVPEAKTRATWLDADRLMIATDWGPGSLTDSGYPRIVKLWTRGRPLSSAEVVMEAAKTDVSAGAYTVVSEGRIYPFVGRHTSFYEALIFYLDLQSGKQKPLPIPPDAEMIGLHRDQLLISLRSDWVLSADQSFKKGSVVGFSFSQFLNQSQLPEVHTVFSPTDRQTVSSVSVSKGKVFVTLLDDVKGKVEALEYQGGQWRSLRLGLPANGNVIATSVNENSELSLFSYQGFLEPDQLYLVRDSGSISKIKELPKRFNTNGMQVKQYFASSRDGERIPYFVVEPKDSKKQKPLPTLLYGYGGFEHSMAPRYAGVMGKLWLEKGGRYVVANIRGGGEYGPRWHQAALKENRQKAYDDFIAVAEALIQGGLATPEKLGIMGGSNGGLLMGVMVTQRPDLFKAVVCQVPLLDMLRYHKLLAGASWMAEYGNPDIAAEREYILRYSPYQNLHAEKKYPEVFFVTSTKDDRVHPAHARKMAARMQELGHPFLYYENIDGGHGAAANLRESAKRMALEYTYLYRKIF